MSFLTFKKYTVIGFYDDNKQPFIEHRTAPDPGTAAQRVAQAAAQSKWDRSNMIIVEVIAGHHKGILGNDEILAAGDIA